MRVLKRFIAICIILAGFLFPPMAVARQPGTTESLAALPTPNEMMATGLVS